MTQSRGAGSTAEGLPSASTPSRPTRGTVRPLLVIAVGSLAALGAALTAVTVILPYEPALFRPAGPVVETSRPLLRTLSHLAGAGTVGALALASFVIPPAARTHRLALDVAAACAWAWALLSVGASALTFLSVAPGFPADLFVPAYV